MKYYLTDKGLVEYLDPLQENRGISLALGAIFHSGIKGFDTFNLGLTGPAGDLQLRSLLSKAEALKLITRDRHKMSPHLLAGSSLKLESIHLGSFEGEKVPYFPVGEGELKPLSRRDVQSSIQLLDQ